MPFGFSRLLYIKHHEIYSCLHFVPKISIISDLTEVCFSSTLYSATPSSHACLVNLLSSLMHTAASRHKQSVQHIYSPGPHSLSVLDCALHFSSILLPESCYQPCLLLVLLLWLPLVKDLSFRSVSALALLIPFCPLRLVTRFLSLLPCLDPVVFQYSLSWFSTKSPVNY